MKQDRQLWRLIIWFEDSDHVLIWMWGCIYSQLRQHIYEQEPDDYELWPFGAN